MIKALQISKLFVNQKNLDTKTFDLKKFGRLNCASRPFYYNLVIYLLI